MRKDFAKVVVERPRSKYISKGEKKRDKRIFADVYDVPPGGKEGIRRPHRRNRFEFNDHVQPLRRYIESQVGRPWNDVYSEICKIFPAGGTLQEHIRGHVFDFILIKTWVGEDGKIYSNGRGSPERVGGGDTYVDPHTGIIQKMADDVSRKKHRKRREEELRNSVRAIDENRRLLKENGVWYFVELGNIPDTFTNRPRLSAYRPLHGVSGERVEGGWLVQDRVYHTVYDVWLKRHFDCKDYSSRFNRLDLYGSYTKYAVRKRSLAKKELKLYKLN